ETVEPPNAEVRPDAAERREELVVRHVEPGRAQAPGEPRRRLVAAVREDRQPPPGLADPPEDLPRPGLDVDPLALAVDERPVDVEHDRPDALKHGATPRSGRRSGRGC